MLIVTKVCEIALACSAVIGLAADPATLGQFLKQFGFAGMCAILIILLISLYRQQLKERQEHNNYVESTHRQQMEIIEKLNVTIGQSAEVQRRTLDVMERTQRAIDRCPHSSSPGPRD